MTRSQLLGNLCGHRDIESSFAYSQHYLIQQSNQLLKFCETSSSHDSLIQSLSISEKECASLSVSVCVCVSRPTNHLIEVVISRRKH